MSPAVIAAIIAGVAGAGLRPLLRRLFRGRTKTVVAESPDGPTETITVNAGATDQDVLREFQRTLLLEAEVARALDRVGASTTYRRGVSVDFIAQVGEKKIAIEVKNSLERVDLRQLLRYFKAEDGIGKLLILSPDQASERVIKEAAAVTDPGPVEFVRVPESGADSQAMATALRAHLE